MEKKEKIEIKYFDIYFRIDEILANAKKDNALTLFILMLNSCPNTKSIKNKS